MFHIACVLPAYLLQRQEAISPLSEIGNSLNEVGVLLSSGYQLFDDLSDVVGISEIMGKPVDMDRDKETSVKVFGVDEVKAQLAEHVQRIKEHLDKIKPNSRLAELVEQMLTMPS